MKTTIVEAKLYIPEEIAYLQKKYDEINFYEYAVYWMKKQKGILSIKTYERYSDLLSRILEGLGHIKLNRITSLHLSLFYEALAQNGVNKKTGGGLSSKTILHHHRLISAILNHAVKELIIPFNPAGKDYIKAPRIQKSEVNCLDENQVSQLIKLINTQNIKWKAILYLLLYLGIRRSELCGLEWKDIDFVNGIIFIRRASVYSKTKGIVTKETKNKSSYRAIKVSKNILSILSEYQLWWDKTRTTQDWFNTDRLFVQRNGLPIHPDSITDKCKKLSDEYLKFTPHILRHTNISHLIASGVPIKQVSIRAGHAQISTTCDIYSHAMKIAELKAVKALDELFDKEINKSFG